MTKVRGRFQLDIAMASFGEASLLGEQASLYTIALALGWCQLVLEEKPDPIGARIVVEREVIANGLVSIAWDNLLHDPNISREGWYRRHILVHTNAVPQLIVGHHLPR